jgi:hypothetical protein
MVAHALPRKFAFYTATAWGPAGGPADWSTNGTYTYVTALDTSGLVQATVANENNRMRPRAMHANIRTLRNGSMSFGIYAHAKTTHAAEAAAATTYHVAELLRAALGGQDLGFGIGFSGGSASAPEVDSDPGFEQGDWIYAFDTSSGIGEFYRIESITAGPPVVLTLDRDLHFTPVGADRAYSVIDCYIHQAATTQHDHASHKTLWCLAQGDESTDVYVAKGVKPSLSIGEITAGVPTQFSFDCAVTTFDIDEAVAEDFGAAIPSGEAGLVAGIGTSTNVRFADYGDPLGATNVSARGSITVTPGVAYERVASPPGWEGVEGHVDSLADTTLEMVLPFDSAFNAEFRDGTKKHVLVQVGESANAWAIYMPRCEYGAEPGRSDEGGLVGSSIMLRALESGTAGLHVPTGDVCDFPTNTSDALTTGGTFAIAGAVQRMVDNLRRHTGQEPVCIMTGGAGWKMAPSMSNQVELVESLIFDGLLEIAGRRFKA